MKTFFVKLFLLCIILSSYSCSSKNWYDIKDSKGHTFLGTWSKLTDDNGEHIIRNPNPSEAVNSQIIVSKDKKEIYVKYGIEDTAYEINSIEVIDDTFVFHLVDSDQSASCRIINDDQSEWVVPTNFKILCTNQPDNYRTETEGTALDDNSGSFGIFQKRDDELYISDPLIAALIEQTTEQDFTAIESFGMWLYKVCSGQIETDFTDIDMAKMFCRFATLEFELRHKYDFDTDLPKNWSLHPYTYVISVECPDILEIARKNNYFGANSEQIETFIQEGVEVR